jgi:uncharacterized protein
MRAVAAKRVAAAVAVAVAVSVSVSAAAAVEGTWLGTLAVPGMPLRVAFKLAKAPGGAYRGTMVSVDQSSQEIACAPLAVDGARVRCEIPSLAVVFDGALAGDAIAGKFTQRGVSFDLKLARVAALPAPARPQEPKPPFPYDAEDVAYDGAGVRLAGTLTRPRGAGPFPAVLLLTGSGAQNRDEELFGHKPFAVIADALTRRGIAVLRVDDRGVGGSTGSTMRATLDDFTADALAGVRFLAARRDIDAHRIGLIGHSEGGLVAPMAAARSKDVAFVVVLAGPAIVGAKILQLQQGTDDKSLEKDLFGLQKRKRELLDQAYALLKTTETDAVLKPKLTALFAELPEIKMMPAEQTRPLVASQVELALSPWFRSFLWFDPAATVEKVRVPVLALYGERDVQVPPAHNMAPLEAALRAGKNPDYTIKKLTGLNHLFQTCQTGAPAEYPRIEETFAPAALTLVGDWVVAHTRAAAR